MVDEDPYTMGAEANDVYLWRRFDDLEMVAYANGTSRPYTAEEIAAKQARVAAAAVIAERAALREAVGGVIDELTDHMDRVQTIIDATNATVNANPAGYIKDLARAVKRGLGTVKDLSKLIG